jgi:EAL domain-containing protein (putative c-di-GMP-specific phosphodiesterase class I)
MSGSCVGPTLFSLTLDACGFSANHLELTESILMEAADSNVALLRQLKDRGVSLAIDDFGTGYSSLAYLKHFPVDRIKIDRSFIRDVPRSADDAAIVEAVIAMSQRLRMDVLAEGVETREQVDFLRERGCDQMQGYFLCGPMEPHRISAILGRHRERKLSFPLEGIHMGVGPR